MGFASLADELGDVFGQDEGMGGGGGRSLADEFGLDEFGMEDEIVGDGSLDEVDGSLDASPEPLDPLTPHLDPSTPPSPTSQSRGPKSISASPSIYHTADEMLDDSPFPRSIDLPSSLSISPSTPPRALPPYPSPTPPPSVSRYTPSFSRDPLVELEDCMSSTSRLILGLKSLHPPPLAGLGESTSTATVTSLRSISSFGSQATIRGLGQEGDVVDRLGAYVASMVKREKRLDARLKELEGMMPRWEGVGYGMGMELDLREVMGEEVGEGLPTPRATGMPSTGSPSGLSSSKSGYVHPFSPPPKSQPQYSSLSPSSDLPLSTHLSSIHPDPLLPTLQALLETLHTHSSHALASQRQVRQVRGAIQGAKERDGAEEAARRGIEVWEGKRVAEGLKGTGAREVLGREMGGFEGALRGFEGEMGERMRAVRGIRAG